MPQIITLKSDDDAFDLIEKINSGELDTDQIELKFEGWPRVNLHIVGEKYHNSITPSMMKAFIELQKGIHRAYAIAQYGTYNTNKLTDEEKKKLELAIGVEDGSSNFDINLQEILEKGFGKAVAKMSSRELIFLILGLGTLYAGATGFNYYLEDRKDARATEVKSEQQQAQLDAMKFMSEEETKRMKIIQKLAQQHPAIDNVKRHAYDTTTEIFKRASTADTISIGDTEITGADAQLLTRNAKRKSEDIRMDGDYRLLEVVSSLSDGFKVKVKNIDTGIVFWSRVQDSVLTESNKQILQDAEWGKYPVTLKINAKDLSGAISQALVISVHKMSNDAITEYLGESDSTETPEES
jgi:hypothetical protein